MEFLELLGYRGDFLSPLNIYVIENLLSTNRLRRVVAEKIYQIIIQYTEFLMKEQVCREEELSPVFKLRLKKYKKQFDILIKVIERSDWEVLTCSLLKMTEFIEQEILLIFTEKNFSHYFIEKNKISFSQPEFSNSLKFNGNLNDYFPEKINLILNILHFGKIFNFIEEKNINFTENINVNYNRLREQYNAHMDIHMRNFIGQLNKIFQYGKLPAKKSKKNIFTFFNEFYEMSFSPAKYNLPDLFYEEYILNENNVSSHLSEENRKNIQILFRFFNILKFFAYKQYRGKDRCTYFIYKNISTVILNHIAASFDWSSKDIDLYIRDKLINSFLPSVGITKLFFSFFNLGIRFFYGNENIREDLKRFIELGRETFSFDGRNIYLWSAFENF